MLQQAKIAGIEAALRQYGVKEADVPGPLGGIASMVGRNFLGHPDQLAKGTDLFRKGNMLHWKNLLWPVNKPAPGAGFWGRAGTHGLNALNVGLGVGLPAYGLYQSLKNPDPSKGKLTNALGAIGETAGGMLGYPIGGMLGGPVIAGAGRRLGEGLGNLLGSRPAPHDMYPEQLS